MKCDNCGSQKSIAKNFNHKINIKNHDINFISKRRFCANCGNLVYDNILDNEASLKGIDIYNKNYGIPKEDIIKLREESKLSQEDFSKLIGCAKKTLISYEKGKSIPNDNFMITLKTLIEHPEELGNRLNANSTSFSTQKINKIENKLDNFLKNNTKQLLLDNDIKLTEFNGYTPLMKDKLINMILLFSKEEINKTKLLKEMFYADFLYFKNNGLSITGLEYSKLPFGPVPDEFESILNNYAERNDISYNVIYHNNFEEDIIKSQRKSDLNVFENSELETINTIKNIFKDYSVTDIVNYSHKEKAYTDTKLFKKISYDYALDINISE